MSDRKLIELAAKAAGIVGEWERDHSFVQERWYFNVPYDNHGMLTGFEWNPLRDDGEALRLAVKLGLSVVAGTYKMAVEFIPQESDDGNICVTEGYDADPCAATRRAIVRAAAEIGKAMP